MIIKDILKRIPFVRKAYQGIKKIYFYCKLKRKMLKKDSITWIMATPVHGNLGDQAIVYAERKFLESAGCYEIVEISNVEYDMYKEILKRLIRPTDRIIIDGGGNMGTLWPKEDDKISEIVQSYMNNKIVVFPQTCYYDMTSAGEQRMRYNSELYRRHPDLTIALRDNASYLFMSENFSGTKIILVPDIVLYLDSLSLEVRRYGVLFCFRSDLEKVISDSEISKLKVYLQASGISWRDTSTILENSVTARKRREQLLLKWKEFAGAKLVITDRLHGMIFAAITGTPCLALDNRSKKVSGVASWIKDLNYIKICLDVAEVLQNIQTYYSSLELGQYQIDKERFTELRKAVGYE